MSKNTLTTKQHVRSSFRDAIFTNLNIGLSESYFTAFMLALGMSEVLSGLGAVIPQFIGVIFQLLSIRSFFTKYSLKRRMVLFLGLQALSLIPLIFAGVYQVNSSALVITMLGLYWASLLSVNPPWNRLIGHTIPSSFRIKFFSLRSQYAQSSVFIGLIASGMVLHAARKNHAELPIFVAIFGLGFLLKCLSIYEIHFNHNDYDLAPGSEERVAAKDFIKRLRQGEQGKLFTFLFFFYIAIYFSAPYFGPFMLKQLKMNYLEFMIITSLSYFGRVLMFRVLQKKAKARQVEKLLMISAIGISFNPLLWSFSQHFWWVVLIEFLSGCWWAGFELSTILLYYQKIDDRERTSVITYIALLNTTGMFLGSMLGALAMKILPAGMSQYLMLFIAGTLLRLTVVVFAPQMNFRGRIPKILTYSFRSPMNILTRIFISKD
jgi:hypothetical protein